MSGRTRRTPPWLHWLAARIVRRRDQGELLSDLDDGYAVRRNSGRGAALWYVAQATHAGWTRRGAIRQTLAGGGTLRLDTCWADLRYAVRRLGRERGFAAAAVVTLALSTGPAVAAFSLANWFYLRPMPGVTNQDQLVAANFGTPSARGYTVSRVSYDHLAKLVARAPSIAGIAGWQPGDVSLSTGTETPRVVPVEFVSGNFFEVLGVRMHAGRAFRADEDRSPLDPPVAVLSYSLARTLFVGRDPVGQSFRANGHLVTVVGVAPPGFLGTRLLEPSAMWLPGMATPRINHYPQESWVYATDRGPFYMHVARLAQGASLERANVELTTAALGMADADPQARKFQTVRANLAPGFGIVPRTFGPVVGILLGVGIVLVLLGVANLANLFVFRGVRRAHEGAIRRALGASAARVTQSQMIHAAVIALVGCALGLGVAMALTRLANGVLLPPGLSVPIDWRVLVMPLALAFVVAVLLGSTPSRMAARSRLAQVMAQTGRGSTSSGRGIRTGLAIIQVVLSLTLFVGALLFTTSLGNLRAIDPGFQPEGVSTFRFGFRLQAYSNERRGAFYRDLLTEVGRHPGVAAAAVADGIPLMGGGVNWRIAPAGLDPTTGGQEVLTTSITSRYFDVVGTPLVAGGTVNDSDTAGTRPETVVISQSLAERLFGTSDAVGRMASFPPSASGPAFDVRVVGVADNVLFNDLKGPLRDIVYRPLLVIRGLNDALIVRSSSSAADIAALVRRASAAIDPSLPITQQITMTDVIDRQLGSQRVFAWTSSLLAVVGFVLAAVGIYGLTAQAATERTREFGIRLALGAERQQVSWLVLRSTVVIVAIGTPVGLALAAGASRLVTSQLFGVAALDPALYAVAACALGAVALSSGAVPAWLAARANPADVMRVE